MVCMWNESYRSMVASRVREFEKIVLYMYAFGFLYYIKFDNVPLYYMENISTSNIFSLTFGCCKNLLVCHFLFAS